MTTPQTTAWEQVRTSMAQATEEYHEAGWDVLTVAADHGAIRCRDAPVTIVFTVPNDTAQELAAINAGAIDRTEIHYRDTPTHRLYLLDVVAPADDTRILIAGGVAREQLDHCTDTADTRVLLRTINDRTVLAVAVERLAPFLSDLE